MSGCGHTAAFAAASRAKFLYEDEEPPPKRVEKLK
jgi:hypothetical protein